MIDRVQVDRGGLPPQEMVRQTVRAEEVDFDFVEISDHFHPWFDSQNHSAFAWSMLVAAAQTERIELATGVTSARLSAIIRL